MNNLQKYSLTESELGLNIELTSMQAVDEPENIRYTTYGLRVTNAQGETLFAAPDVDTNKQRLQSFIELCADSDVRIIHIPDLLEDYLA